MIQDISLLCRPLTATEVMRVFVIQLCPQEVVVMLFFTLKNEIKFCENFAAKKERNSDIFIIGWNLHRRPFYNGRGIQCRASRVF